MGSREDRLLAEQLERMADLGVEPAALPPVGAEPAWSPEDIEAAPPPCDVEPVPFLDPPSAAPGMLEAIEQAEADVKAITGIAEIPNEGHYIGLRNGSQPGPDGWKPAVTPPEERMIFGAPLNRTVAEVEAGTHGSPELDADAEKLVSMGQDPGPTLEQLDPSFVLPTDGPVDAPDFAEVEGAEPGGAEPFVEIPLKPAWAVGDLCLYDDHLAEVIAVSLCHADLDVWQVALKKGGYEWSARGRFGIPDCDLSEIDADSDAGTDRFYVDALRQHKAALAAESTARRAHNASDRLLRAHYALAEAQGALALVGKAVKVADAESTAA